MKVAPQHRAGDEPGTVYVPAMDHMDQEMRRRAMKVTAQKVAQWADTYHAYSGLNDEERRGAIPPDAVTRDTLIDAVLDWLDEAATEFAPVFFVLRRGDNVLWQWGEERPSMLLLRPAEFAELEHEWVQSGLPAHLYAPQTGAPDVEPVRPAAPKPTSGAADAQQALQPLGAVEWHTGDRDAERELFRGKSVAFREALLARIGQLTRAGNTRDSEELKLLQALLAQLSAVIRYPYEQQLRAAIRRSRRMDEQKF